MSIMRTTDELHSLLATTQELMDAGLSSYRIKADCASGILRRLERGVFINTHDLQSLNPWENYPMRVLAKHKISQGTVFSHQSAAGLLDFSLLYPNADKIHIYCQPTSRGTHSGVVKHARLTKNTPLTRLECGVLVTAPTTTLIDCAQVMSFRDAVVTAESALHQRAVPLDILTPSMLSYGGRNYRKVHAVAASLTGLSESPGETLTRLLLDDMGISYIQQYWVNDYRADFFLPDYKAFLEFDGALKYNQFGVYEDVLRRERERERCFLNSGARIFRTDWNTVYAHPYLFKEQLRQFLR